LETTVVFRYLNTDLDLISPHDLTALAATFEAQGMCQLHLSRGDDGLWRASFETASQYQEPEPNIAELLGAAEGLPAAAISDWWACTLRGLNVGYECGREPRVFSHMLSAEILRRMCTAGAALRITLYPEDKAEG
jgi:hypothetical protein